MTVADVREREGREKDGRGWGSQVVGEKEGKGGIKGEGKGKRREGREIVNVC